MPDVKSEVRDFIKNNFLYASDIDSIGDDDSFTQRGIIDSTGVLELIDFLEEKFGIIIENDEVIPDNLDSLNRIERYVASKAA
ncbi:MAG: acyl carrier protein [Thermoplasmatota archaeon]